MVSFGWSYPPGCEGVPDDDAPTDPALELSEIITNLPELGEATEEQREAIFQAVKKWFEVARAEAEAAEEASLEYFNRYVAGD